MGDFEDDASVEVEVGALLRKTKQNIATISIQTREMDLFSNAN